MTQDVKNYSSITNPFTRVQWCSSMHSSAIKKCDSEFIEANSGTFNSSWLILIQIFYFICSNSWTDRLQLNLKGLSRDSVGDLPHLRWAEAGRWYPGCGTESALTGACPTRWASARGRPPWSSSSACWCWRDASAGPRESYRTPMPSKEGKSRRSRGGGQVNQENNEGRKNKQWKEIVEVGLGREWKRYVLCLGENRTKGKKC